MEFEHLFKIAGFILTTRLADYLYDSTRRLPTNFPVDALLALTEFFGKKNRVLCYGDTDHSSDDIAGLMSSPELHSGLARRGFRDFALENSVIMREMFNQLRNKEIPPRKFVRFYRRHCSSWLTWKAKTRIALNMAESASSRSLVFHPIDHRKTILSNNTLPEPLSTALYVYGMATSPFLLGARICFPYSRLSRCVAQILAAPLMHSSRFLNFLTDDTKPAQYILGRLRRAPNCKMVVYYGAGHFNGLAEKYGTKGLAAHLQDAGVKTAVLNIHPDLNAMNRYNKQAQNLADPFYRPPAANFIIRPAEGEPHILFSETAQEVAFRKFLKRGNNRPSVRLTSSFPANSF